MVVKGLAGKKTASPSGSEPNGTDCRVRCGVMRVAEACIEVRSLDDLKKLMCTHLAALIPHEMCVFGVFERDSRRVVRLINNGYPGEYLQQVIRPDQCVCSYVMERWLTCREPIQIDVHDAHAGNSKEWRQIALKNRIERLVANGQFESDALTFSFFVFAQRASARDRASIRAIQLLTPFLHAALTRALTQSHLDIVLPGSTQSQACAQAVSELAGEYSGGTLTRREGEILHWLRQGKTNWEIAHILKISEHTVKNHVQNIFRKRGVVNRVQVALT